MANVARLRVLFGVVIGLGAWLTGQFGASWWILLGLLAVDAVMNYHHELAFWHKVGMQLVALAGSAIVQGSAGIALVHLILVGLVGWETIRVTDQVQAIIASMQAHSGLPAAEGAGLSAAVTDLEKRIQQLERAEG